jgi:hypothetical protein
MIEMNLIIRKKLDENLTYLFLMIIISCSFIYFDAMKKLFSFVLVFSTFLVGFSMVWWWAHAQVSSISLPSKTHDISSILNRLVDMSTWSKWKDSSIFKQNDNLKHFKYIADLIANTTGEKQKNVFLDHVSEIQKDKKTSRVVDRVLAWIAEKLYLSETPPTSELDENKKSIVWEQRKAEALQFLKDNRMDTPENRALINAVQFTSDAIEIWWVKWAYENLKASDVGMDYTTDTSENPADYTQAHIFKWEGDFVDEDYFTRKAIDTLPASKKAKVPNFIDMRKTLEAIPWWPIGKIASVSSSQTPDSLLWSAKLLSILLWTKMSGYRITGERYFIHTSGFLRSVSPRVGITIKDGAYEGSNYGGRFSVFNNEYAFPVRPLANWR